MSDKKYYVFLSPLNNGNKPFFQLVRFGFMAELFGFAKCNTKNKNGRYENKYSKFTKSELAEIMDGVLYRTFTHQFNPELAEELYKLGYKTTQTTEEWIEDRYEFDNIWEWINPLIELVPVEDGE